jgi:site-specific DNA-methyltransferase (adenine-specific)
MRQPHIETIGPCTLVLGDALTAADWAGVAPGSIAAIVTDPPYASGGFSETGKRTFKNMGVKSERLGWFEGDNMTSIGIAWLLRQHAVDQYDFLRVGGTLTMFMDWRMIPMLSPAIESARYRFQGMPVWDKGSAGMGIGFRAQHECMMHFAKGVPVYNSASNGNVLTVKRTPADQREHPTEKPLQLLERIAETVSAPGDLVADWFAGSGSMAVACVNLGRRFIGAEIDETFFERACERIRQAVGRGRLFTLGSTPTSTEPMQLEGGGEPVVTTAAQPEPAAADVVTTDVQPDAEAFKRHTWALRGMTLSDGALVKSVECVARGELCPQPIECVNANRCIDLHAIPNHPEDVRNGGATIMLEVEPRPAPALFDLPAGVEPPTHDHLGNALPPGMFVVAEGEPVRDLPFDSVEVFAVAKPRTKFVGTLSDEALAAKSRKVRELNTAHEITQHEAGRIIEAALAGDFELTPEAAAVGMRQILDAVDEDVAAWRLSKMPGHETTCVQWAALDDAGRAHWRAAYEGHLKEPTTRHDQTVAAWRLTQLPPAARGLVGWHEIEESVREDWRGKWRDNVGSYVDESELPS